MRELSKRLEDYQAVQSNLHRQHSGARIDLQIELEHTRNLVNNITLAVIICFILIVIYIETRVPEKSLLV